MFKKDIFDLAQGGKRRQKRKHLWRDPCTMPVYEPSMTPVSSGQMNLYQVIQWHLAEKGVGIEMMVCRVNEHIGHIQQHPTSRCFDQTLKKLRLAYRALGKFQHIRHVFENERLSQVLLEPHYLLCHVPE